MTSMYSADGVDVTEGDLFSRFAGEICRQSFRNSPFVRVRDLSRGHFRGPRGFTLKNLPKGYFLDTPSDGVGTKVIIILKKPLLDFQQFAFFSTINSIFASL